ncbi:MAG: type II toxin-antitoxin system RelE/ParE family toxin [Clostridia bacterium]|nr:type II toxin-antitoxin system RelE/ParE family toxin [Clostridia bacterium]
MSYALYIAASAEDDLNEAADYIEYELKNPQAAVDLMEAVYEAVSTLTENPARNPLVGDAVLKAWGMRFIRVKNYLVFYTVDADALRVDVIRVLYAKRNWMSILRGAGN